MAFRRVWKENQKKVRKSNCYMNKLNFIFIVLCFFFSPHLSAQEKEYGARNTFTVDDMEELLMANHPIV